MKNRVSSHSKAYHSLLVVFFCLLAASCDFPQGFGNGKGSLTIILPGPEQNSTARGVHLPEPITGNMSYTLEFYGPGGLISYGPTREKVITVELEPGYWDIIVTAYYETAMAALDKRPHVEIRAGQANSISFTMDADEFLTPDVNGWVNQDKSMDPGDSPEPLSIVLKTSIIFSTIPEWTDDFSYRWYYEDAGGNKDYDSLVPFPVPPAPDTVSSSYLVDPGILGMGTFHYYVEVTNNFTYTSDGTTTPPRTVTKNIYVAKVVIGSSTSYSIGSTGPGGGTVFYYNSAGFMSNGVLCHYLEAAPADLPSTGWGADGTFLGATGTAIGSGYANTQTIVTALSGTSESGRAARVAAAYTLSGGYTDWFLPSQDELGELYTSGVVSGLGPSIWTSTEIDATTAWCGGSAGPNPVDFWQDPKPGTLEFRPVRAF